ncbi:ferredoxin [Candidatus Woesearchaeota archaeon]|nr:ferredoxin [Candidatus Woesearchaeota archaeon]
MKPNKEMSGEFPIKIIHERNVCIGCCACESIEPKFWKMNTDNKVDLVGAKKEGDEVYTLELKEMQGNMEAAESCPVNCIHVEEKGIKKI